ncbi:hypothetical protein M5K25_016587 [Dendrobium thyrsiflorum]|uniref:Alcohol dehydrogenase N-terminal domain-containing protein n=1 Tax=Dendrobium thyrsiflorum TaxID=117978 RepID=A0ABD0USB1_DENTH
MGKSRRGAVELSGQRLERGWGGGGGGIGEAGCWGVRRRLGGGPKGTGGWSFGRGLWWGGGEKVLGRKLKRCGGRMRKGKGSRNCEPRNPPKVDGTFITGTHLFSETFSKENSLKVLNGALQDGDVSLRITHCGVCYADVAWTRNLLNNSIYPVVPG